MNRRSFVLGTAAMSGSYAVRGWSSPNDTIRIGCVGVGGQGAKHINLFTRPYRAPFVVPEKL